MFLAVGIDFGTTYSGVSWAFSEDPGEFHEIQEWPAHYHNDQGQVQVPTQFDLLHGKWGYEVTPRMNPMKWFKLLLLKEDDPVLKEEVRNSVHLRQARAQLQEPGAPKPVEVVGKYLQKLWDHTYLQLEARCDVENIPLKVAITVPAIWPPYAQKAMREAANIAGITKERDIGRTTLDLVQEPEAAGLWTLFERGELPEIQAGESFVVCDAGGGTVDVISYTVDTVKPFQVRECVKGDGKLSGAFRIDEAFEAHIRGMKRLKISSLEQVEFNVFITEDWEMGAKRSFTGNPEPAKFILRPPAKAFKKMDRWRGKDNFFLTKEELKGFFNESLAGIHTLVNDQYKGVQAATGRPPKKILLVGGLGDSPYIYSVLNSEFRGAVLRPLHSWSAVARGAVIRLLRDKVSSRYLSAAHRSILTRMPDVTSRKSRYSYGILAEVDVEDLQDFDAGLDDCRINPEGKTVTLRMDWYLRKGEEVTKKSPVLVPYYELSRKRPPRKCVFIIQYSAADHPPKRPEASVLELCRIECAWDRPFEEWKPVGKTGEGWRRYDGLAVTMSFEGEPKWKVCVGSNQTEQDAKVDYMD